MELMGQAHGAAARRFERAPSLREHALAEIRQAITVGELAEHTVYSAAGLAKQLGISLSPVREAMMSLVAEGTVEAVPNRGYRLVPVTEADLEEITMIRVLLAVPAAQRLAESGTREQLVRLRELADLSLEAARRQDRTAFLLADRLFYETLLRQGLGNRAAEISLQLRDQSRLGEVGDRSAAVNLRSAEEACELVDLIAAGNAEAAAELVRTNLYYFKRPEPAELREPTEPPEPTEPREPTEAKAASEVAVAGARAAGEASVAEATRKPTGASGGGEGR